MIDWGKLQRRAYGIMGISPDVFWGMTFKEFSHTSKGYEEKLENDRWLLAWQTSYQLMPHSGGRVTPSMLMGEEKQSKTREEIIAERRKLRAKFKGKYKEWRV